MEQTHFLHRIKHTLKNGTWTWDKGIEVHDTADSAKQSYHAYFGAYGYENDANTDYVSCKVTDINGTVLFGYDETWQKEPEKQGSEE